MAYVLKVLNGYLCCTLADFNLVMLLRCGISKAILVCASAFILIMLSGSHK